MKTENIERMLVACRSTRFPSQPCVEQATAELAALHSENQRLQRDNTEIRKVEGATYRKLAIATACLEVLKEAKLFAAMDALKKMEECK